MKSKKQKGLQKLKKETEYEDKVSRVLDEIHKKKTEFKKVQKELQTKQKPSQESHENLVKLQEENAQLKLKIIGAKSKKPGTPEEKPLKEELEKIQKTIESDNNRTKFYLKRFENDLKSINEAIAKTREELNAKEKINDSLGKFLFLQIYNFHIELKIKAQKKLIKENQQKARAEAMKQREKEEMVLGSEGDEGDEYSIEDDPKDDGMFTLNKL